MIRTVMKFVRNFALVAIALACTGATAPDDSYSLNWKPVEGQSIDYTLSVKFTLDGQAFEAISDIAIKVSKLEGNGDYTVESLRKNNRVIVAGEEKRDPDSDDAKPEIEKFNAKGEKITKDEVVEDEDDLTALLSSIGDLKPPKDPVKKGDKWTEEVKADEKRHIKAAKIDYEVVGIEKIGAYDVVKVSMAYKQTEGSKPVRYEGSIAFDIRDMSVVLVEASIDDAPFDDQTSGQVKLKMTRA